MPDGYPGQAKRRPMVGLGIAVVAGMALGASAIISLELLWVASFALLVAGMALRRSRRSTLLVHLAVAAVAACRFQLTDPGLSPASIDRMAGQLPVEEAEVEGWICSEPEFHPYGSRNLGFWLFSLQCEGIRAGGGWTTRRGTIDVVLSGAEASTVARIGDRVRLAGVLAKRKYPGGHAIELKVVRPGDCLTISTRHAALRPGSLGRAIRGALEGRLEVGIEDLASQQAILKALVLGRRDAVPRETMEPFRRTGAIHIFAISGLHVGIAGLLLAVLLQAAGMPRDWLGAGLLPLLSLYVVATGMSASALRALTMAGVYLLAPLVRREPDVPSSVAFAAILLLFIQPMELLSAGFVFSFAVVSALVMAYSAVPAHWLAHGGWLRRYVVSLAVTSFAASLAAMPLTALYFGTYSPIALAGNLVVVPLTFCIVLSGWLSLAIPFLSGLFNHAAVAFIDLMVSAVRLLDAVPGSCVDVVSPPLPAVLLWFASLAYLFTHGSVRRALPPALAGLVLAMLWGLAG